LFEEEELALEPAKDEMAKPVNAQNGMVKQHRLDADGNLVGMSYANPLLDVCEYEIKLPYGMVDVSLEDGLAEVTCIQVDEHG
jgi:hypothetical protein